MTELTDTFSKQHSDDTEGLECVLLAATDLFELDSDISEYLDRKLATTISGDKSAML